MGVKTTRRDEEKKGKRKNEDKHIEACARSYGGSRYRTETISLLTYRACIPRVVKLLEMCGEAPRVSFRKSVFYARGVYTVERIRSKQAPPKQRSSSLARFTSSRTKGTQRRRRNESLKRAGETGELSFAYDGNYLRVDIRRLKESKNFSNASVREQHTSPACLLSSGPVCLCNMIKCSALALSIALNVLGTIRQAVPQSDLLIILRAAHLIAERKVCFHLSAHAPCILPAR